MQKQSGARQMAQKTMAQPSAFSRTLDQTRNIGDDKTALETDPNDTQVGVQGREWIIRDARPRIRDLRNKGGLARIGHPEQTYIGQHFELEAQQSLLTGLTIGGLAGRPVNAALKVQVPQPPLAAAR